MSLRKIFVHPDPILKKVCTPVEKFDEELAKLVRDMAETMYAAPGVGLAAPQVGVSKRLFVMDTRENANGDEPTAGLRVFVNPEIIERKGEFKWEEGCLSVPNIHEEVTRAKEIVVKAFNEKGEPFTLAAEGFPAVVIQHEYDHLDGILLIDRLSALKRRFVVKRYLKEQAKNETEKTPGKANL